MTENITNIINYDDLTGIRHPGNLSLMPKTNTLVSLELIERLDKGVKVLINGKLFIAIIDEPVPLKEELLAWVTSANKLSLSLNFEKQLANNKDKLLKEIIAKLKLPNDISNKPVIERIIKEKKPIIKSKVIQLIELVKSMNIDFDRNQFILLVNIVWNNSTDENNFAKDIVENLFAEPFEDVCKKVVASLKELLFANITPFIINEINNKLVYNEEENNSIALQSKTDSIITIIKSLNNYLEFNKPANNKLLLEKFIEYGSKYILQKMILEEYSFYSDFIAVKHNNDIATIMVEIKKTNSGSNNHSYTLKFKYKNKPLAFDGLVKDYFLIGNFMMELSNEINIDDKIEKFRKELWLKNNINSNITVNSNNQNKNLEQISKLKINKLVS